MFMVFFGPLLYTDDKLVMESIPEALQSRQTPHVSV